MPTPETRLYKPERLNRWFAVSSLIMTISLLWMITIDYDRPWRAFQNRYFVGKAALAHLDFLDASTEQRQQELAQAQQRVRDAEQFLQQTAAGKEDALRAELTDADLKFNLANGAWSRKDQVLLVTRDTYEKALNTHGPDHEETRAVHARLTAEEEEVERLRKDKEGWEDRKAQVQTELDQLTKPVRVASKKLRELQDIAEDALRRDQSYRGVLADDGILGGIPLVRGLINAPILDFAAPKTTPARHQVKQLVLPDVRQRLNYLDSYTTDRCTTCHVAIDDPEFAQDRLARKLERSLASINEALQRRGEAPLDLPDPPVAAAGSQLPPAQVTLHWNRLSPQQRNTYFDALLERVNNYLEQSGRKTIDLGQPLLAHPDLSLYVSVDSSHPMQRMGCTVCHEGNPQETDFVLAAHSPETHKIRERWEDEYYLRRLGVPNTTFETVEHYWDRPMLLPRYTEAGCAKCHQQISDIDDFEGDRKGERINLGRHLFTNLGCVNCHNVDALPNQRRVGPDLTYIADKLQPEFVQQWVFTPQAFRPSTRMPHFFQQENSRTVAANSLDPDPMLRTQTEVAAISKYLFAVSDEWTPTPLPQSIKGDAERGRKLFRSTGCLACHANITEFGQEWIAEDVKQSESVDDETAQHRYLGMTHEQRVRYSLNAFPGDVDTFLDPESARFDSERKHNPPTFTRFAPELSGIGSKTTFEWLYAWVIDPSHYAPDTKMPNMRLNEREAADLAAYLMTLRNNEFQQEEFELDTPRRTMADTLIFTLLTAQRSERRSREIMNDAGGELTDMTIALLTSSLGRQRADQLIRPMPLEDKKMMYLGNKMILHYGCYTCHKIRGFEDTTPVGTDLSTWAEKPITQLDFANYDHAFHHLREEKPDTFGFVYPLDADRLNHWSPIDDRAKEQIAQTHAGFAKHKLLNPRIWDREKLKKPYAKLKMPNFYLTEREAEALSTFLLSRIPPRVSETLTIDYEVDTLGPIAAGRNLTRELNCIGCHEIEDNAPTIQQYFRRLIAGRPDFDIINAPPSLRGEGAKVQHNWFHRFLQQVEPLRPWLQVRMPSFTLTGEQATVLAEYFAALSRRDAEKLTESRAPIDEFLQQRLEQGDASDPSTPWHHNAALERSTDHLKRWAIDRKVMRAARLDPLETPPERVRKAHDDLLSRIDFLSELYDVAFPFVEPPRPLTSQERFQRGFRFFKDMGCLQCHVLGNMLPGPATNTDDFVNVYRLDDVRGEGEQAVAVLNGQTYPIGAVIDGHTLISAEKTYNESGDADTKALLEGPNAEGETERIMLLPPSAPNLSLTYQRLRRAWVFDWMLEPQWIQPGTKMPQNFPGAQSPFEGDAAYPGNGIDHINLLVDFLYQAGATSTRAPMQKIVIAEETEEFDDDEGFDDETFDEDEFDE